MPSKILNISKNVILGIFLFYLIVGFILIPLVLWWGIPNQGSKFLKKPVKLGFVTFNPFLLQLDLKAFKVLDNNNQPLIAFDRLFIDFNFKDLFKKIYRIEEIDLEGLSVNAVLMDNGHINLIDLLPSSENTSTTKEAAAVQMPVIILDQFNLIRGQAHFTDQSITPKFSTILDGIKLSVTDVTSHLDRPIRISFQAALDERGIISSEALLEHLTPPITLDGTFSLNGYALQVLSPYIGKYTGHALKDGKLDLKMDYRIKNNTLTASHKLLIQHFEFGQTVESKDALHLPFGLAVALLEDPKGRIRIPLPVTGDVASPNFHYSHLVVSVFKNFFMKVVTKPFSILGSMLGASESSTDELGYIKFVPGKTDLLDSEKEKLKILVKGFKERPKLKLEIDGGYDPDVDWAAIKKEAFNKNYRELRQKMSKADTVVYQDLYQRQFGIRALWALAKKYKKGFASYDEEKFNQEIKRQLIEKAPVDKTAIDILAKARAEKIYDYMLSIGCDPSQVALGKSHAVQSSLGFVPLEFTLTVKGE